VEDEHTNRSFYYVTNAEVIKSQRADTAKIRIRRTSTKPDIVSTKMAREIRESVDEKGKEAITNMR
jgi:hypothetical protein